jgi:hypothetical protein
MGIGQGWLRLAVSILALASIPLGLSAGGLVQLVVILGLLVVMLFLEHKREKKAANHA